MEEKMLLQWFVLVQAVKLLMRHCLETMDLLEMCLPDNHKVICSNFPIFQRSLQATLKCKGTGKKGVTMLLFLLAAEL